MREAAGEKRPKQKAFSTINTNAFITVVAILTVILFLCGALSYFVPQGSFERDVNGEIITDSYTRQEVSGIAFWRVLTAPVRVFASSDALTIIMISVFLLVMSGIFNILEKTGGVKSRCIPFNEEKLSDVCVCCGKPAKKMVVWGRQY